MNNPAIAGMTSEQRLTACLDLLRDYERWEGELILDEIAWDYGRAELPTLTYSLYDGMMALQARRNELLEKAK